MKSDEATDKKNYSLDDEITNFARYMQPLTQPPSMEAIENSKYFTVTYENGRIWN